MGRIIKRGVGDPRGESDLISFFHRGLLAKLSSHFRPSSFTCVALVLLLLVVAAPAEACCFAKFEVSDTSRMRYVLCPLAVGVYRSPRFVDGPCQNNG